MSSWLWVQWPTPYFFLDFPTTTDCNLKLLAKANPFSLSCFSWDNFFLNQSSRNETFGRELSILKGRNTLNSLYRYMVTQSPTLISFRKHLSSTLKTYFWSQFIPSFSWPRDLWQFWRLGYLIQNTLFWKILSLICCLNHVYWTICKLNLWGIPTKIQWDTKNWHWHFNSISVIFRLSLL